MAMLNNQMVAKIAHELSASNQTWQVKSITQWLMTMERNKLELLEVASQEIT